MSGAIRSHVPKFSSDKNFPKSPRLRRSTRPTSPANPLQYEHGYEQFLRTSRPTAKSVTAMASSAHLWPTNARHQRCADPIRRRGTHCRARPRPNLRALAHAYTDRQRIHQVRFRTHELDNPTVWGRLLTKFRPISERLSQAVRIVIGGFSAISQKTRRGQAVKRESQFNPGI